MMITIPDKSTSIPLCLSLIALAGCESAQTLGPEAQAAAPGDIYIMDSDGRNQINLTRSSFFDFFPVWSPDGSEIAFVSDRSDEFSDIYVMNADGKNPRQLTNDSANNQSPAWSPDGSKVAYHSVKTAG